MLFVKITQLIFAAYANIIEEEGSDVHGVAFCMSLDSVRELDSTERGYNKKMVKTKERKKERKRKQGRKRVPQKW